MLGDIIAFFMDLRFNSFHVAHFHAIHIAREAETKKNNTAIALHFVCFARAHTELQYHQIGVLYLGRPIFYLCVASFSLSLNSTRIVVFPHHPEMHK